MVFSNVLNVLSNIWVQYNKVVLGWGGSGPGWGGGACSEGILSNLGRMTIFTRLSLGFLQQGEKMIECLLFFNDIW